MKLRQIEAFRAIMQTGSMTTTAKNLHTSQPQISRLIAQLEAETQFPLFERNGSRLKPTLDGQRFYEDVEKTFSGISSLEAAAATIRSFGKDRLVLAAMPRLAGGLLARAVALFKTEFPKVTVTIQSGNESTISEWVRTSMCSTALAMLYDQPVDIIVEPVVTTECVVVFPKGHPFGALDVIAPKDFEGQDFIAFPVASPMRRTVDKIFDADNINRRIVAEANLGSSICAMVGAGLGVSLINPLAAQEEMTASLIESRPFSEHIPVTIGLLFPSHTTQPRIVRAFSRCARELMMKELGGL